jgi:hypothetical protein
MSEISQGFDTSRPIAERLLESETVFTVIAPFVSILVAIGFALWAAAAASQDVISQAVHNRRARMAKIPPG